jgi:cytochrome d ubiquinol oxidase subunit I
VVAGVCAWYLLQKRSQPMARKGLSMALWAALALAPLQALVGDFHGLNVKEHQPIKLAAMEGIWPEKEAGAPLLLFAIPDMENETNHFEIAIPKLASLILTHELDGELQGLKSVAPEDRPYVPMVFYTFRIMVGIGVAMIGVALLGLWLRRGQRLYSSPLLLRLCTLMTPTGVIATVAGWYVVEVGRQPWLVNGLVRTIDVVSPLPAERVLFSLSLFVITYSLLLGVYLYFMRKLIRKGPPEFGHLQEHLIGTNAPGYALAWVKKLEHAEVVH